MTITTAVELTFAALLRTTPLIITLFGIFPVAAQPAPEAGDALNDTPPPAAGTSAARERVSDTAATFEATARASDDAGNGNRERAASAVTRAEIQERLPRSAPDALRYEPGVYVQQTAHGQASPYVRGMTGQQVVHSFDGVRMNNGIYRQGPNQYFFTVDSLTIERIEVVRGSASTRHGSDALGGAILALPREPCAGEAEGGFELRPRAYGKLATQDLEHGGRVEIESSYGERTATLLGGGYRQAGLLESAGAVRNDGLPAAPVPRFEDDGRTQLGTGFREATFDARVRQRLWRRLHLIGALYGYRQLDAPRTDQCPPPEAPDSECLRIEEQFRTLGYLSLRGPAGRELRQTSLTLSWQNHHEQRLRERPRSFVEHSWEDDVDTLGLALRASTRDFRLGEQASWTIDFGADAYRDGVASGARQRFTDLEQSFELSRGQYLDGSAYLSLGSFAEVAVEPVAWLGLRSGGRVSAIGARAPPDAESGSPAVNRQWTAAVGRVGAELRPFAPLSLAVNLDQGFRAPNLDDLTSRQQTGPGFQLENPALSPERSDTLELGLLADLDWLRLDAWAFVTFIDDAITRAVRTAADCPPGTPSCRASRTQLQLVNAGEPSRILGSEGKITVHLPFATTIRATYAYAWGEGPNPSAPTGAEPVPLSRIPPFNGTLEARWRHLQTGIYAAGALRWALAQTRLAPTDLSDARIPPGGTPGYALLDLRAGWRFSERLRLHLVFENVLDTAYRVHGSSVSGPGRGLTVGAMAGW